MGYKYGGGDSSLEDPLLALDVVDGSTRTLVDGPGTFASFPTDAGSRLVFDRPDDQGRYTFWTGSKELDDPTLLFTGDRAWNDPGSLMVRPDWWSAMESPGWVPVFPGQYAYVWPDIAGSHDGEPRELVSLAVERARQVATAPTSPRAP